MSPLLQADEAARGQRALDCFQVAQPVLGPKGPVYQEVRRGNDDKGKDSAGACTVELMDHSFGNSFGKPFV
ncbi:Peptide-N4-(N-acetyl-beta-glucosaminyl)asparagine amidase A, partial [Colletotrichum sp. SAR 10_66]